MSKIKQMVMELAKPIAEKLELEVVEVEYAKKHNGMNLTIFIHKEGGVTLADCERLHKLLDAPLDELNPTDDKPYILNVSSLGLDRPLKTKADFDRNIGKELHIKLYRAIEGKKEIKGTLIGFDDGIIKIMPSDGTVREIKQADASKVTLNINI
ncbi:MAG: ribosome maturation factor RimP [Clostridiales bacterium]|jgi:ribosome maturation factor RimP|nr:ribosome maturation factor RimP [Clostridiales bacterium]